MKVKGDSQRTVELRDIMNHVRKRLRVKVSRGNVGAKRLLKLIPRVTFVFHEAYETRTRKYCPRSRWSNESVFNTPGQLAHAHYGRNIICISVSRFWEENENFKRYVLVAHELMHLLFRTTEASKETRIHHPDEFWYQFISVFGKRVVKNDYHNDKKVRALNGN